MNSALRERILNVKTAHPEYGVERVAACLGLGRPAIRTTYDQMIADGTIGKVANQFSGFVAAPQASTPPPVEEDLHVDLRTRLKSPAARAGALSVVDLANDLDRSPRAIEEALADLRAGGFAIQVQAGHVIAGDVEPGGRSITHDMTRYRGTPFKFGATGDNHLGSRWERLDVLNALYDLYEAEGVTHVYNTGNMIEGECRINKLDVKVYGLDAQVDYLIQNYPHRKGITTHFVCGDDHEGWYQKREGIEIGRHIENQAKRAGREDLAYMGYVEADVVLKAEHGERIMKVMHPGGGSAYALSYTVQKLTESFQGGEKPSVLLVGHYHKFDYCYPREVFAVQTACTCDQSIFMRKLKLQAVVGGCLISLTQAPDGEISRFSTEFLPFYNRGYYGIPRNFGVSA